MTLHRKGTLMTQYTYPEYLQKFAPDEFRRTQKVVKCPRCDKSMRYRGTEYDPVWHQTMAKWVCPDQWTCGQIVKLRID